MSFQAQLAASLGWKWNDGAVDSGRLGYAESLLDGSGQAEAVWHAEDQSLLDGASTTLDLTNLTRRVLEDVHTVAFSDIRAILLVNLVSSDGELLVGGAATDGWSAPFGSGSDLLAIPPGSPLLLANCANGWEADTAQRNLKLTASGGDVTYAVAIVGNRTSSGSGSGT